MTKIMYDHYSLRYKIKYFNLFIKMLNFKKKMFSKTYKLTEKCAIFKIHELSTV